MPDGVLAIMEELQQRITVLEGSLKARAELQVEFLVGDDKLARLYTDLPTYDSFKTLVQYLEPKVVDTIAWLDLKGKQGESCCFHRMSVANQLLYASTFKAGSEC